MIRWRTRRLRRKNQPPVPSAERQKQLWLAGAELDGVPDVESERALECPDCAAEYETRLRDEREALEDMGFSQ